jgi:hypothetical protein
MVSADGKRITIIQARLNAKERWVVSLNQVWDGCLVKVASVPGAKDDELVGHDQGTEGFELQPSQQDIHVNAEKGIDVCACEEGARHFTKMGLVAQTG